MLAPTLQALGLDRKRVVLDVAPDGWALFSADRKKRYGLGRFLRSGLFLPQEPRVLICCGLNPSKAGAYNPDQTITKMVGFAEIHRCVGLCMVNLEPAIGTNPDTVSGSASAEDDAIVRAIIEYVTAEAIPLTIAAWGSHDLASFARVKTLLEMLPEPVFCFGTTASGDPRHPSRLAYATPLEQWHPVPTHPSSARRTRRAS